MCALFLWVALQVCQLSGACPLTPSRPLPRDISPDPTPTKPER